MIMKWYLATIILHICTEVASKKTIFCDTHIIHKHPNTDKNRSHNSDKMFQQSLFIYIQYIDFKPVKGFLTILKCLTMWNNKYNLLQLISAYDWALLSQFFK